MTNALNLQETIVLFYLVKNSRIQLHSTIDRFTRDATHYTQHYNKS